MQPDSDGIQYSTDDSERKGDQQTLITGAQAAVEHARRYDPGRLSQALTTYVQLLSRDGQHEQAKCHAEEILQLDQRSQSAVEAIIALGISAAAAGNLDDAAARFHQAADLSRQIRYAMGLAKALQFLVSQVLVVRGQFHLALTLMEEAGSVRDTLGGKHWSEAFWRGFIYQTVGDRRHCREVLDELVVQFEPGTRMAAAYYLLWSRLALDEDDPEQAKELLRLGLRVATRVDVRDLNLWIRLEQSRCYRLRSEAPVARTWAEDALSMARSTGLQYFVGLAYLERAQTNWDSSDREAAEADIEEALRVLEPLEASYDVARARYLRALWYRQIAHSQAEPAWLDAIQAIIRGGYAFLLEKEQDVAFPLIAAHARSKNPQVRSATESLLRHLANVVPPSLRIYGLGQFAVWKGRRRVPDQALGRRKAGELLRFLLLQPSRAAGREVIIEALWPDHNSDNPSDLLNQATSALRHALEPDLPDKFPSRYLKVEGEYITLTLPPGSVVDFETFERALPIAIQTRSVDRLQEALNLYSGEIFPSDRYADWSAEKRQFLAELRQRGLVSLANALLESERFYEVIACARQVMQVDPWNEDAVLLAMQAYSGMQNVPHALQVYKDLERTLKEELMIMPRKDLRSYAEKLRTR